MSSLETLLKTVKTDAGEHARIETLLLALADRIKSTSNDQNVQKLARELRAEARELATIVCEKAPA